MTTAEQWESQAALERERASEERRRRALPLRQAFYVWVAAATAGWLTVVALTWLATQAF